MKLSDTRRKELTALVAEKELQELLNTEPERTLHAIVLYGCPGCAGLSDEDLLKRCRKAGLAAGHLACVLDELTIERQPDQSP